MHQIKLFHEAWSLDPDCFLSGDPDIPDYPIEAIYYPWAMHEMEEEEEYITQLGRTALDGSQEPSEA